MSSEPLLQRCIAAAPRSISPQGRKIGIAAVWILAPWLLGAILAVIIPSADHLPEPARTLSNILGWVYFAAWSVSFYPQLWLNYTRKSVVGLSLDFQLLNMVGFACYAIYNITLLYNSAVRDEYAALHSGLAPAVHPNDAFFALHAALATAVTLVQCIIYDRGGARPATATIAAVGTAVMLSAAWAAAVVFFPPVYCSGRPHYCPGDLLTWLTWLYFLSYIKLGVTLVKYIPQVVLNCSRRSTEGWNVWNVLLDIEGGLLSLLQLLMDASVCSDWSPVTGNPVKFALGWTSLVFDAIFVAQHCTWAPRLRAEAAAAAMEADLEKPDMCFGTCCCARNRMNSNITREGNEEEEGVAGPSRGSCSCSPGSDDDGEGGSGERQSLLPCIEI